MSCYFKLADLGFRITGGKRLNNGELGAFVSAVNRSKPYETLEIKEGASACF